MVEREKTRRLEILGRAHLGYQRKFTPVMEDYIEIIFELIKEKGYARVVEIAEILHVKSATVTGMIKRLHDNELLLYERYRGVELSKKGEDLAKSIRESHGTIAEFLRLLGVEERKAHKAAEGIEHYIDSSALIRLASLTRLFNDDPDLRKKYKKYNII